MSKFQSSVPDSSSVVGHNEYGWILDNKKAIDESNYQNADSSQQNIYKFRGELFSLEDVFLMDSEYDKIMKQRDGENVRDKKKRKRKYDLHPGEQALQEYYGKVKDIIDTAYEQLLQLAKKKGYFTSSEILPNIEHSTHTGKNDQTKESHSQMGNNKEARASCSLLDPLDGLSDICRSAIDWFPNIPPFSFTKKDGVSSGFAPVNIIYCNPLNVVKHLRFGNNNYIIPPNSTFLLSDVTHLPLLQSLEKKYGILVMDPPWENKSVKRKKSYDMLSEDDILAMPLRDLLDSNAVVFVWVTNKQRQQEFVKHHLFPKLGVKFLTQWYWLKVTKQGLPVYPLESPHKKPFEVLMIGVSSLTNCHIPQSQVIVSVPCAAHSKKPPIHVIIEHMFPGERYLELFARNLLPKWTSWGNEVLKFQHTNYFEELTRTTE